MIRIEMTTERQTIGVRVLFFARAHELAGTSRGTLELPAGARVADAQAELRSKYPALAPFIDRCRIAVDEEFAEPERELTEGCELAVLPPVSGG